MTPPCIPYLGVYLTDLIFLEEGNPDRVKHTVAAEGEEAADARELELINWEKHQNYATIIEDIRFYQQTHYNLARCEPLQEFLSDVMADTVLSADEQYARSLEIEPRGQPGSAGTPASTPASTSHSSRRSASVKDPRNLWREALAGKRGSTPGSIVTNLAMNAGI